VQIRLTWEDPVTGERKQPLLTVPITLGRDFGQLPGDIDGRRACRLVLSGLEVSRYHATIDFNGNELFILNRNQSNGVLVNGQRQERAVILPGDVITIGSYQIAIALPDTLQPTLPPSQSQIRFNPVTNRPDRSVTQPEVGSVNSFLPAICQVQQLDPQAIFATGLPVEEIDYATIGGGIGSFIWADLLRISGVKADRIRVLGTEPKPYGRYQQLCLNAQIQPTDRLRSPADACPENIWGFPSYALRETIDDLLKGRWRSSLVDLWQIFGDNTIAPTHTPRAKEAIAAIDREAARISWQQMFRTAHVEAIRQTTDGRYAIAYARQQPTDYAWTIAKYVHIAPGYPALQFLPDLQAYRDRTQDAKSVVNAYEAHEHIYTSLAERGGVLLLRGNGSIAARIVNKIYHLRRNHDRVDIRIIHLMSAPKTVGNKYGLASRSIEHNYEFQTFPWPKACWGGQYQAILENAPPEVRQNLLADWGGATTIDRKDWRRIITGGIGKGWYQIVYGDVREVLPHPTNKSIVTKIDPSSNNRNLKEIVADFIIDATAVDAPVTASPLLADLVTHYNLPLNYLQRLTISPEFELTELANQSGKIYACGAIVQGNYYAPVDSFLGLQYAAWSTIQNLLAHNAPDLQPLILSRSLRQWYYWMSNRAPN
jgi:pSer/pThr/pTyr-binding forkhead associated (FHA) protein